VSDLTSQASSWVLITACKRSPFLCSSHHPCS